MPGVPGAPGPQGQQGKDGAKGEPGVKGPRGMTGTRGQKGNPGSLGKNGAPGMMGIKGNKGHEGSRGSSGPPGIKGVKGEQGSKGEKGEIVNSAVSETNWKQCCVWKNLNDDRDSGKIKVQKYLENAMKNEVSDCSFNKLQSDTAIKVSFQGNMRVDGTSSKCNRWFFKFNGNECSGPMTIDAVVYNNWPSGNPNLLHHRSFEGYCENIPQGRVTVELWVGQCHGSYPLGDAHTGWNSVSRIMIEEVSRAHFRAHRCLSSSFSKTSRTPFDLLGVTNDRMTSSPTLSSSRGFISASGFGPGGSKSAVALALLYFFHPVFSFQGNMRVEGTSAKCNRWFFKFNGNECNGSMTIDAVVYNYWPSGNPNLYHHRSFEGYCENILQGRVTVELWVGKCLSGHTLGVSSMGITTSPQQQNPQTGADKDPCEEPLCSFSRQQNIKEHQKSVFARGFSGIPGSNGIRGMPRIPGVPRPQGQHGKDGAKGEPGFKGPRGMTGTRGQKGNLGSLGKNGAPGMMGIKGDKGHEGSRGSNGLPGIKGVKGEQGSKGEKGEIVNSAVSQTNWKQCVRRSLSDDRDSGKI
ncbi:unnamed protein product, partial [Pocillopora meandrina]